MDITHTIVFVLGLFLGGTLVLSFFKWRQGRAYVLTDRAVDPKSRLGFDVSQRDRF